ncbi:hypothetical protein JNUCC23_00900 [Peribacillus sp. JNUCC 23]|uniref:hypothetical protein n=1 Tax=Peribacillus sp. NPDC096379 TaxID=3364393 RepID=UPI003829EC83
MNYSMMWAEFEEMEVVEFEKAWNLGLIIKKEDLPKGPLPHITSFKVCGGWVRMERSLSRKNGLPTEIYRVNKV